MKKLLNVFYITSPEAYLALDGQNLVIKKERETSLSIPLHNLENIVCFGYQGASPALMGACAEHQIGLCFLTPQGRFLGRVSGKVQGNVLLRKKQYQISDNEAESVKIAANFLTGKIINGKRVIKRCVRDHAYLVNVDHLQEHAAQLQEAAESLPEHQSIADLMGVEGAAARIYFSVFDEMILHQKESFYFRERSRRPPLDNVNALLSFLYTILANEVTSALETVGLDPYVGFLHQDRPGRPSLALDLMEELRPVFVDRLVLSLINRKQIDKNGFVQKENGSVLMDDDTRKVVLNAWQDRKKEIITHPFLKEKFQFGLIPYAQALLLARHIRGDLEAYPPYFWH